MSHWVVRRRQSGDPPPGFASGRFTERGCDVVQLPNLHPVTRAATRPGGDQGWRTAVLGGAAVEPRTGAIAVLPPAED